MIGKIMNKAKKILVIVESPAKAKTISGYLKDHNDEYVVLASYGHVRQLPRAKGSIKPDDDFKMKWTVQKESAEHLQKIVDAANSLDPECDSILLATDFDREGNGIAFHIRDLLQNAYQISVPIQRIVFKEITKNSILDAINNHMALDMNSVCAYFARLALDYLVGFNISPILWTKLKGCKSAGRVQSAALRAIIDRDREVVSFVPQEYWTLDAEFNIENNAYKAHLIGLYGSKVPEQLTQDVVNHAQQDLMHEAYKISHLEIKNMMSSPKPPLITSTMQQIAAKVFSWHASKTMRVAQSLYEGVQMGDAVSGLITYMRTDSTRLSDIALQEIHDLIKNQYGTSYVSPKNHSVKSGQDAHEAIRPTNIQLLPSHVSKFLTPEQNKLYDLIWRYTVASQMSEMRSSMLTIKIASDNSEWSTSMQHTEFAGFARLFPEHLVSNSYIHQVKTSDNVMLSKLSAEKHMTRSRGHFSESGLIKYLDEVGIGRPSTYASIVDTLEYRGYISRNNKQIIANPKGWLVIGLLSEFCSQYIEDDFTATMERQLDAIASGQNEWKHVMHEFWNKFTAVINDGNELEAKTISQKIFDRYPEYFLGIENNKSCEKCDGTKVLCVTNKAEFIGCSNYPTCTWMKNLNNVEEKSIGNDHDTDEMILMRKGMYGHYLHWSISKKNIGLSEKLLKNMTIDTAMMIKKMPIILGQHPITKKDVVVNIGRYGTYIAHDNHYTSFDIAKANHITLKDALYLLGLSESKQKRTKQ
jgi:DNA topoisomerase-1